MLDPAHPQAARRAHEAAGEGGASHRASTETNEQIRARVLVGQRCTVFPGDRRGEVMYVGPIAEFKTKEADALWIGVKYDLPLGKNDGRAEVRGVAFGRSCNAS